ncbi:MAG TPA: DEAD/DEAH box helicase family protein [Bryobacteraceae bacterium]|nr:DEAD/DEAH box helicase family protein [Bryobacteraceae bacterium]
MNRHVNAIAGRLSLRQPQRRSLEILDRLTEIAPPRKSTDIEAALAVIRSEFPSVTEFEDRAFPSVCFALATGVGKTRLMGAFITYLHLAHGINHFFVLAPNLTIYEKLIADFTPNTPKYVFKGIAEFATEAPAIITGDTYESVAGTLYEEQFRCQINIFNISKINSEVRGGKAPRIKRLSEYIGESYFAYLAGLPDLVLLMDESHRYRASAGVKAINELKPVLGLELTATPFVETSKGPVGFRNIILNYPLGQAMADGFVKQPAVVTRKNFSTAGMSADDVQKIKLEDGVRLHEIVKVELETYARETSNAPVKPFLLVIARDTTHARQLMELIQADSFFGGGYRDKVIQVDSSKTGAEEEEMIARLLKVEHTNEPTEIVIHVNMLKEGWDVTNLYTIVPLRAANARTLIEQSIGRGLRLPYGKRTGVAAVDRLNIVAHDRFQEIVDEANRPGSVLHIQQIELDPDELARKPVTVVSQARLEAKLGFAPEAPSGMAPPSEIERTFARAEDERVAQIAYGVIKRLENQPTLVPTMAHLARPEVQAEIVKAVKEQLQPSQLTLDGVIEPPDVAAVVAKTTELVARETIEIPRILVIPTGEVRSGYRPFELKLDTLRYPPVSEDLWVHYLGKNEQETVTVGRGGIEERRLEDYIVSGLVDFDDVSYDDHADLLYDLAQKTVQHFQTYLGEDDTRKVLQYYRDELARFIHAQMLDHYWEEASGYEVKVTKGFTELKRSAYTAGAKDVLLDFRQSPQDKSNMAKYLFGGFEYCLFDTAQKFQSDTERRLAVILEREKMKWFRPARGQFQIFYSAKADQLEYQPDFVAEGADCIYMLEPKMKKEMEDPDVLAKRAAAIKWCSLASDHAVSYGAKPWKYVLIPHEAVVDNMTIAGLADRFA